MDASYAFLIALIALVAVWIVFFNDDDPDAPA